MERLITSIVLVLTVLTFSAHAQNASPSPTNYLELRVATSGKGLSYGYVEYSKRFGKDNRIVFDNYMNHSPGQDEISNGLGYDFKVKSKNDKVDLVFTPAIYNTIGRTGGEWGITAGLQVIGQVQGLNVSAFVGHFEPFKGSTKRYTFGDSVDASKPISKHVEIGASLEFFQQSGNWNPLIGPILKFNDKQGSWSVLYRVGHNQEVQLRRTFSF